MKPENLERLKRAEKRPLIYIAGPLMSSGNPFVNLGEAINAAEIAYQRGWAPIVPHLSGIWEMFNAVDDGAERWLELDYAMLSVCEAILILPGKSSGAEAEEDLARGLNLTIFKGPVWDSLPNASSYQLVRREKYNGQS